MFADAQVPVLFQTAKVQLLNLGDKCDHPCIIDRAVMDTGSQRTYVTQRVKQRLQLTPVRQDDLLIKTFACNYPYNNLSM